MRTAPARAGRFFPPPPPCSPLPRSLVLSSLALCSLVALAPAAFATGGWPHESACRQWAKVAVPKQDVGDAPAGCDAEALYYGRDGQGEGRDFVAARHCAYRERGTGADIEQQSQAFGGSGALMMLYANGQGVKRDPALARLFACEYGGAPAEISGRLAHIDAIAKGTVKEPMDLYDDVTSGMMMGVCASRDAGFAKVARDTRWDALQARWTPAQREAWSAVRTAADDYFEHAASDEVDMSGTARGALAVGAREHLEIALLDAVARFEDDRRPARKASELAQLDKALNATYKRTLATLDAGRNGDGPGDHGTIASAGVRDTQRAWLRYRDAWVRFAGTRWPGTPANAWKAWLTAERTAALDALVSGD